MGSKYDELLFGDLESAVETSSPQVGSSHPESHKTPTLPTTSAPTPTSGAGQGGPSGGAAAAARRRKKKRTAAVTRAEQDLDQARAKGTLLKPVDASLLYDMSPKEGMEEEEQGGEGGEGKGKKEEEEEKEEKRRENEVLALNASLFAMAQEGALCDATLRVYPGEEVGGEGEGEGEAREFTVHRAVLAAVSPYFRELFSASEHPAGATVELPGLNPELFGKMLEYMYMGSARVFIDPSPFALRPDPPHVVLSTLLKLGMMYQVVALVSAVTTEAVRRISVDNVLPILEAVRSDVCSDPESPGASYIHALSRVCLHTIRIALDAFGDDALVPLSLEDLVAVVGSSDVAVSSEKVVVDIVFAWLKANKKRFAHKDIVLNLIRYFALSESELEETRGKLNKAMNKSIIDAQLEAVEAGDIPHVLRGHVVHPLSCRATHELSTSSGSPLFCVSLADSRIFAAGSADGKVSVWAVRGWRHLATMEGHKGPVRGAAVCGTTMYSVSHDRSIRGWDMVSWEPTTSLFSAHQAPIWCIAEYDLTLVTGDAEGVVKIWQEDDGVDIFNGGVTGNGLSNVATLKEHTGGIVSMTTADASLYTASEDATVRIWNIMSHECLKVLAIGKLALTTIAASPFMVAAAYVDGSVHVWRKNPSAPSSSSGAAPAGTGASSSMRSFDIAAASSGRTIRALMFLDDFKTGIPSRYVLTGVTDGSIKVWDVCPDAHDVSEESGEEGDARLIRVLDVHGQSVNGLVPSGKGFFVSGSSDGSARVWE